MTDITETKTIKIGKVHVGLVGFDAAINQLLNNKLLTDDEAVSLLFNVVSRHNYIPVNSVELYKKALRREYRRRTGKEVDLKNELVIRVLGPGCTSCNNLTTMLIETLQKLDLAADLESIHDLDEIWRYGVVNTPALLINNEIKCAGKSPTPAMVKQWIREATSSWELFNH